MQGATPTVVVLHPGQMGSAVAASIRASGAHVTWVAAGRSAATRARAEADGLDAMPSLSAVLAGADLVVSVCPPAAALEVAREVAALGFAGTYLDANAISPARAREVASTVAASGATPVDGGIVGGPPRRTGTTRLYLSGPHEAVATVCALLEPGPLEAIDLGAGADSDLGAASALKMAYAAYTKGTTALLTAIHALALHEGVHDALLAEWGRSQRDLLDDSARAMPSAAAKAWRWVAEMEEIAATFRDAGLPGGFHDAAAEVYRQLEGFKDDPTAPGGAALARHLLPNG